MTEQPTTEPGDKRVNVGSPVNIFRGFNLTIDCIVINGTPPFTILWLRNDTEQIGSNSSSITINVTDAYDGDNITCRADNIGYDMATTTINVQGIFIISFHYTYVKQILVVAFQAPHLGYS